MDDIQRIPDSFLHIDQSKTALMECKLFGSNHKRGSVVCRLLFQCLLALAFLASRAACRCLMITLHGLQ